MVIVTLLVQFKSLPNFGRITNFTRPIMTIKQTDKFNFLLGADQLRGDLIGNRPSAGIATNPVGPLWLNSAHHLHQSHGHSFNSMFRRITQWPRRQVINGEARRKILSEAMTKVSIVRWMHQEQRGL